SCCDQPAPPRMKKGQWLRPGETFFVIKAGGEEGLTQDAEAAPRQDFCVYYHGPAWVMVYARGVTWVEDEEGNTIECGQQRPNA
ncbi:hypothetical protein, partial [Actinomadura sp. LOL_011]